MTPSAGAVAVRGAAEKTKRGCLSLLLFAGNQVAAIRRAVVGEFGKPPLEGLETLELDGQDGRPAALDVLGTGGRGRPKGIDVFETQTPGAQPGRPCRVNRKLVQPLHCRTRRLRGTCTDGAMGVADLSQTAPLA